MSLYSPPKVRPEWEHAPNDWFQSIIEGGLLGASFLLLILCT
jgi:hypothetical protein